MSGDVGSWVDELVKEEKKLREPKCFGLLEEQELKNVRELALKFARGELPRTVNVHKLTTFIREKTGGKVGHHAYRLYLDRLVNEQKRNKS